MHSWSKTNYPGPWLQCNYLFPICLRTPWKAWQPTITQSADLTWKCSLKRGASWPRYTNQSERLRNTHTVKWFFGDVPTQKCRWYYWVVVDIRTAAPCGATSALQTAAAEYTWPARPTRDLPESYQRPTSPIRDIPESYQKPVSPIRDISVSYQRPTRLRPQTC